MRLPLSTCVDDSNTIVFFQVASLLALRLVISQAINTTRAIVKLGTPATWGKGRSNLRRTTQRIAARIPFSTSDHLAAPAGISASNAEGWAKRCEEFARSEGFSYYAFGLIVPLEGRRPAQFVLTNYPVGWLRVYDEFSYSLVDPVAARLLTSITPFVWHELPRPTPKIRTFWNRAARFKLEFGVTVPVHGPRAQHAALGLSGVEHMVSQDGRVELYQRTWYFAVCMLEEVLKTYTDQELTYESALNDKQREALSLVAQGRSIKDIAVALSLHPRTIEYHLRSAMERLKATTREQAIVSALLSGDIEEANYPGLLRNWCLRVRTT